jgi:hypothetical protein
MRREERLNLAAIETSIVFVPYESTPKAHNDEEGKLNEFRFDIINVEKNSSHSARN